LGEVARNPRQGTDPASIDPETPYIGLEHIPRKSIAISDWGGAEDVGSTKSMMRKGQFLFGKLRPYFHKVGLVPVDGICSTDILVVEAKTDPWREYVLSVISSVDLVDHVNAASTGTRMPRAKWQDLAEYEVVIAPPGIIAAFSQIVRPMHQRILSVIAENQTLASLRDSLLPRLMSGELRVGEARDRVEEIA
jgi:type I restriction enzyme S subunit